MGITKSKDTELTKRQAQILEFIKAHIQKSGFPPTILEIQEKFFFRSPNAVQEHLKALARKGYIRKNPNKWRGLEVPGFDKTKAETTHTSTLSVPLIGRIAAGSPLLAEENVEGTVSVDKSLVRSSGKLFALRVRGESMIKAGIYDGDIIIARQQPVADSGDIIVALIGDEATVKRFLRMKKLLMLQPENDAMKAINVSGREDFRILGKVVATLRRM